MMTEEARVATIGRAAYEVVRAYVATSSPQAFPWEPWRDLNKAMRDSVMNSAREVIAAPGVSADEWADRWFKPNSSSRSEHLARTRLFWTAVQLMIGRQID